MDFSSFRPVLGGFGGRMMAFGLNVLTIGYRYEVSCKKEYLFTIIYGSICTNNVFSMEKS